MPTVKDAVQAWLETNYDGQTDIADTNPAYTYIYISYKGGRFDIDLSTRLDYYEYSDTGDGGEWKALNYADPEFFQKLAEIIKKHTGLDPRNAQ